MNVRIVPTDKRRTGKVHAVILEDPNPYWVGKPECHIGNSLITFEETTAPVNCVRCLVALFQKGMKEV